MQRGVLLCQADTLLVLGKCEQMVWSSLDYGQPDLWPALPLSKEGTIAKRTRKADM
jgi:hypothetical protein